MLTEIRDTRLYVDQRGAADAPPLLYLHGGPGAGSYDFLAFQGDRLAERLRLIGVDQRGVQQSDPIDGPVTEDIVIADVEALRKQLGFERWAVLGHSYGGRLALRYAATHPSSVSKVVFENPPWDMVLATRTLVESARPLLTELGLQDEADKLLHWSGPATIEMWIERTSLLHRLGDRRMEIYLGPASRDLKLPAEDLPRGHPGARRLLRRDHYAQSGLQRVPDPTLTAPRPTGPTRQRRTRSRHQSRGDHPFPNRRPHRDLPALRRRRPLSPCGAACGVRRDCHRLRSQLKAAE